MWKPERATTRASKCDTVRQTEGDFSSASSILLFEEPCQYTASPSRQ
jgi:hypothetical protein